MKVKIRRTVTQMLALCAAIATSMTMVVAPADAAVQVTFYVDGVNGNDSNPGTSNAPFKTIDMARQQVASVNANMTGDIDVNIAPGDYYLSSTLTFGPADSGTNGYNVVYQSGDGVPGSVRIIGGSLVTGWQVTTAADLAADLPSAAVGKVFKTQLPAGTNFNTLYVNDQRALMARTKNYTYNPRFPAASGTSSNEYMRTTGGDAYSITYGSDLDANSIQGLVNAQTRGQLDAQFVIWSGYGTDGSDWYQETLPIGNVDTSGKRLTAIKDPQHPEVNHTHWTFSGGYRYFVQGNLSFLDAPGEYYLNKTTGWLYYYPAASEVNPSTGMINVPVVRPTMQKAIYFKGANKTSLSAVPVPAQQVHNIVLNGLTIKDTEFANSYLYAWNAYDAYGMQFFPPEATGSTNPSYCEDTDRVEYHVGAITLTDTNHITIENSRVTNAGMNAIEVFRDNDSLTVTNSKLDHLGMGGIDSDGGYPGIGKYNGNHTISNVLIHDIGRLAGSQPGISLASTGHSTLSHLEIFNSPRRAILLNAGYLRSQTYDGAYNPMNDMYTVGNHFSDVYVHDSEQDSGEDSPIFGWILMNKDLVYQYTSPHSYDPGPAHYNYFDQVVIDNIGANPSMHDKNTVLGMDFAVGPTGVIFSNIKSTNIQSYNMDAYSFQTFTNVNYNQKDGAPNNTGVNTFNDSLMDYANIGLTSTFPTQFAITHTGPTPPSNVYFSEDFEGASIDTTNKWIAEKGTPVQSTVYMAEGPFYGKKALAIDTTANPNGQLLTRTFTTSLNKIVSMKFFDRRIDLAYSDTDAKHLPNSWGRVDDGVTEEALGADGRVSTDYFLVKSGSTTTVTTVPRGFGWHEFKWDYTSGSGVTMSIDGTVVATQSLTSFNFLSMGDPDGSGAIDYFDDLYVYGGAAAPPPGNQVQPVAINGTLTPDNYSAIYNSRVLAAPAPEGGDFAGYFYPGSYLDYFVNVAKSGVYQVTYRISDISPYNGAVQFIVDGVAQKTTTFASTGGWYNWTNVNDTVTLTAGLHTIRLLVAQNGWNFKSAQLTYLAQAIPGQIKAVDYDAESGAIQTVAGSEGPAVGYLSANNYLDYNVIVAATDTYSLSYRVAVNSGYTGSVQFLVDGVVQKTTSLPSTGGWDSWATVNDTVSLTAGAHTIRILVVANGWNFGWFKLASTRQSLPGQIDGPSYIAASTGVRVIPITDSGTTQGVGWFQNGYYMDYNVNVAAAGNYTLSYRVAVNAGYTGLVAFQVDGSTVKSTSLPTTGDWQNWTTVTDTVTLPAGQHTIRLLVSNNGWNLHWFSLQ